MVEVVAKVEVEVDPLPLFIDSNYQQNPNANLVAIKFAVWLL